MYRVVVYRSINRHIGLSSLEQDSLEGDTPVYTWKSIYCALYESSCLGLQLKVGGKFHLKLNTGGRPIAYKYREGKMQRTLKRELKSTWNCWKGSEGNQCLFYAILLLLLATEALWFSMGQHGFDSEEMALWEVGSFRTEDHFVLFWVGSRIVTCARDAGEMVFFTPSWNTDQGV